MSTQTQPPYTNQAAVDEAAAEERARQATMAVVARMYAEHGTSAWDERVEQLRKTLDPAADVPVTDPKEARHILDEAFNQHRSGFIRMLNFCREDMFHQATERAVVLNHVKDHMTQSIEALLMEIYNVAPASGSDDDGGFKLNLQAGMDTIPTDQPEPGRRKGRWQRSNRYSQS